MLSTASDTSRILPYSALWFLRCVLAYSVFFSILLRHIRTYWEIVKAYPGLFKHIQHPVQSSHIYKLDIFWAIGYLEPETYLKLREPFTRDIQNTAVGHYSAIFRKIQNLMQCLHMQKPVILRILEYSELSMLTHIQNPVIFTKIYKYSGLWYI